MKKLTLYLAGSIQKGHEPNESEWTQKDINILESVLKDVQILNPAFRQDDLSDQKSVFGRDMLQVFLADALFVDARHRRGLGVGAEMMWAKFLHKPVVTLAPVNTHYNKSETSLLGVKIQDYIHPFIYNLSDHIALSIEDGALFLKGHFEIKGKIKGIRDVEEAMRYYRDHQFLHDNPMKELFSSDLLNEI